MLIKLKNIVADFDLNIRGVIHIGAHYGQEYQDYKEQGIKNLMFFEPVEKNYQELVNRLPRKSSIKTYNLALGNEMGEKEMYIDTVKGQSCSFLEPGTHLGLHPKIKFTEKQKVRIVKLDNLGFDHSLYNMINIDVQGFELEVFKGAVQTLKYIDIIYTEVNFEDVYRECCKVDDLDYYLKNFGFKRVLTKDSGVGNGRNTWGDALYIRKHKALPSFDESVKQSYCFNQIQFEAEQDKWDLLNELYNRNFIEPDSIRDYNTLPKKVHQIWLGSDPLEWHTKLAESWKKYNPEWEYKLWTDKDVDLVISDRKVYDSIKNNGQKADLLRYHILDQFGGVYADTDFECFKSFNSLTYLDFLIGVAYPSKVEFYNSLIGCTANHPIIRNVIDSIKEVKTNHSRDIFNTTGGYLLTRKFFEVVTEYQKGILTMPTDYFYPYPNKPGFENEEGRRYIKDCSYTIHYWELLWLPIHQRIINSRKQERRY